MRLSCLEQQVKQVKLLEEKSNARVSLKRQQLGHCKWEKIITVGAQNTIMALPSWSLGTHIYIYTRESNIVFELSFWFHHYKV